jgi:hypothetical protein
MAITLKEESILNEWAMVVDYAGLDWAVALKTKIGKDSKLIQRGSKGFLEIR